MVALVAGRAGRAKFTEKGTITIAAHQGQENGRDWVTFAVADTGIGMTPVRMGCDIVQVYKDHGISGAKGREKRPAFDRLCRDAAQRKFDVVMAWSVDRLGRSLQDLVGFLSELHALRIDLFLHQQGLDTTTPAGKALFQMLGVFAEFERAMIQERVRAGLARAKSEGKRLGRPPIAADVEKAIRAALAEPGRPGVRKIAARFGVDPGTVQRINSPFDGVSVSVT